METILAALEVVPEPLRSFANILVEVCAYAGTGNVLKIQQLLHICSEPPQEEEAKDDKAEKGMLSVNITWTILWLLFVDKKDKKKDKKDKEKNKDGRLNKQAAAVIGVALIAMGEDIGRWRFNICNESDFCMRSSRISSGKWTEKNVSYSRVFFVFLALNNELNRLLIMIIFLAVKYGCNSVILKVRHSNLYNIKFVY